MFDPVKDDSDFRFIRIFAIGCFILLAACLRILPHPWNFTPVGAMALFGGAKLRSPWAALLFPLSTLFFGDVFIGFHRLIPIVYLSFCLSVVIGRLFRNRQSFLPLFGATLLGAAQFFLITNFAVWAFGSTYVKSPLGLLSCYAAGIPYFGNTLAGDFLYAVVLFGGFAMAEQFSPALREVKPRLPA